MTSRSKAPCPAWSPENKAYCCLQTTGTGLAFSGCLILEPSKQLLSVTSLSHFDFYIRFSFFLKLTKWNQKATHLTMLQLLHPLPSFQSIKAWVKLYLVVDLISPPSPGASLGHHLTKCVPPAFPTPCQPVGQLYMSACEFMFWGSICDNMGIAGCSDRAKLVCYTCFFFFGWVA